MPSQVRKKSKAVCFMGRNQEADLEAYHGKACLGCWAQGLFFTNHIPRGRRIYIQVRSSVSGPAPSPLLQKKLLPKQCFTRLRAIKGTWKEEKRGKRNGSVRKQKPSSSAWVSAIKCCETVPSGKACRALIACHHFHIQVVLGFVAESPLSPVRPRVVLFAWGCLICKQKQLRRRGNYSVQETGISGMHTMCIYTQVIWSFTLSSMHLFWKLLWVIYKKCYFYYSGALEEANYLITLCEVKRRVKWTIWVSLKTLIFFCCP